MATECRLRTLTARPSNPSDLHLQESAGAAAPRLLQNRSYRAPPSPAADAVAFTYRYRVLRAFILYPAAGGPPEVYWSRTCITVHTPVVYSVRGAPSAAASLLRTVRS